MHFYNNFTKECLQESLSTVIMYSVLYWCTRHCQ